MDNVPFNIVDLFYQAAASNPGKVALIEANRKITFGDFEKEITLTARYFNEKGIKKGDRVLVFVPMSIDLYRTVLAIFRIGATAVFLDEWVSKKRMEACCQIAECDAFIGIFKARILAIFSSELRKIPIHLGLKYHTAGSALPFPETIADDTALITFTTGSTGIPKAAKRTHSLLYEQFKALSDIIKPAETDVSMPVLPIVLLINLGLGITSVIADFKAAKPESIRPERLVKQCIDHEVSTIIASPFFVNEVSRYLLRRHFVLPLVSKIFTGGAPVFPAEVTLFKRAFSHTSVEIVYGSTEAEPISSIKADVLLAPDEANAGKGLNVGTIDKNATVKIIKITSQPILPTDTEEFKSWEMARGVVGEIIVSGPHVLREYINNEEALRQNKIFVDGKCWHRTGDSGYLDKAGKLFLTGRCSTLIFKNNQLVSPFIFESSIQVLDGIAAGTLLLINNKITAILELKKDAEQELVIEQVNSLPQKPDDIIFVKTIPKDPRHHSKIDYEKLREMLVN